MRIEYDNNYGADVDGNRGHKVCEAYLDSDDTDTVVDKLYNSFLEGSTSGDMEIEIDGYTFDVFFSDYLGDLYDRAMNDETVLADDELVEWLKSDVEPLL